jgi:hypothetical protein
MKILDKMRFTSSKSINHGQGAEVNGDAGPGRGLRAGGCTWKLEYLLGPNFLYFSP